MQGHVSYLSDECPACLIMLTVERDIFFELSEAKKKIVEVRTRKIHQKNKLNNADKRILFASG